MPERIDRARLQQLMESGAQVVDVLPEDEYREQHLPGAINIPLKQLTAGAAAQLSKQRPVIVYCYDYQ
ncbi:MAG: rhodanese-like domain-containing protein [Actinomycetota bacterium]